MAYSVRGVARRYRNFVPGQAISIPDDFITHPASGVTLSLRGILRFLAATEHAFPTGECIYAWWAGWQQFWSHVVVRVRLVPDPSIDPAALTNAMARWKARIEKTWSNRFSCVRSGERACRISIEVIWVTGGEHHTVYVSPGGVEDEDMSHWYISTTENVAAHEFGHMLGLSDEYERDVCPDRNPVNTGRVMDEACDANVNNVDISYFQRFANAIGSNLI